MEDFHKPVSTDIYFIGGIVLDGDVYEMSIV